MQDYYVYEWYNVETGIIFYVGKGKGRRWRSLSSRTKHFLYYHSKHDCDVRKLWQGLSNDCALELEHFRILELKKLGMAFCNYTEGGENPPVMSGEKNGMFGKTHTADSRRIISEKHKEGGKFAGTKNPQSGVSPRERMDEGTYSRWREAHKKSLSGDKNPQKGISPKDRMDAETYDGWRRKQRARKDGASNPNAKKVDMYDSDRVFIMSFSCLKDAATYLIAAGISKCKKPESVMASMWAAKKSNDTLYGFYFSYANDEK